MSDRMTDEEFARIAGRVECADLLTAEARRARKQEANLEALVDAKRVLASALLIDAFAGATAGLIVKWTQTPAAAVTLAEVERDRLREEVERLKAEYGAVLGRVALLTSELNDARRVWDNAAVTPSGAERVRGLSVLRDEIAACKADNLRLASENVHLRLALQNETAAADRVDNHQDRPHAAPPHKQED